MVVSRTYFPPGRTLPRYSVSRSETNTCNLLYWNKNPLFLRMDVIRGYEQDLSSTCADITLLTGKLRLATSQEEVVSTTFALSLFASNPFLSHQQSRAFLYKIKNMSGVHDVCRARSLVLRRSGDPWADWTWMSYFGSGDNKMMMTKMTMIMMRRTSMTMMIILMMQEVTITVTMMAVIKFEEFFIRTDILHDNLM